MTGSALPTMLTLLVAIVAGGTASAKDERPNVVVILADDMGYGDVRALNPDSTIPTPSLDRLAAEGMTFTDAHSPSAVCTPTRYGLLTGRYCWRSRLKSGVLNGYGRPLIEPDRPTLGSFMTEHGYATGIVGKWHLGLEFAKGPDGETLDFAQPVRGGPDQLGFGDTYVIPASLDFPPYVYIENGRVTDPRTVTQPKERFPSFLREGPRAEDLVMTDVLDHLTERATSFIRERAAGEAPYFLYFPLTAPHKPVLPHPRFRDRSGLGPYGDFIAQVDWTVGEVLRAIDESGEAENTLVIYTSDNGSFMYRRDEPDARDHVDDDTIQAYRADRHRSNHAFRGTKADIWEAGHHVPFFARWPVAVEAGTRSNATLCHTDILATLAEIVGAAVPRSAPDSFSFRSALAGDDWKRDEPVIHHSGSGTFAIRDGEWKLVLGNGSGGREKPRGKPFERPYQLFDLSRDIAERDDLIERHPDVAARLEAELERIREAGDAVGVDDLRAATPEDLARHDGDWLIEPPEREASAHRTDDGRVVLTNGLVRREWRVRPNLACVEYQDLGDGSTLLRAVRPEARVTLDGVPYDVGGLVGQPNQAFLTEEWLRDMTADPAAFRFVGLEVGEPRERMAWKRNRHAAPDATWPPAGIHLRFDFAPPDVGPDGATPPDVITSVHYELYDGIPALSKWITVENRSGATVEVDRFTCELLAVVEHDNPVELRDGVSFQPPDVLHVETDYAFGGFKHRNASRHSVHWRPDPQFATQVNYRRQTPCLLEVEPTRGPDQLVPPGETFESFRAFELVHSRRADRERRGLALRKMYRTVAPWITENPLILHVVSVDPDVVHTAIDQAVECGFEMVSLSFGSGLSMEDESPENLAKFRELTDYAAERDIHLGGYSLLSSRRIQPDTDNCVNPETGQPGGQIHGFCPALASPWGQEYFRKLRLFFEETGFLQFTHDGSYPGDFDAAARPPLQRGLDDSQWVQWRIITDFYRFLRARGAYLRVPDYYYLQGGNECGMGYRETNWSLPRDQQVIHTRQNIFDGTWEKTPSMGWMFVPLTQYHGGGAAATIEPLDEHLDHYERMLMSNLGLGVQAVYRGHRLYDTPRVRDAVKRHVDWYKRYRDILESDLIHGRRADGRDLDWMLHANPKLETKGMLVVFNPLPEPVERTLDVDLYYTGLEETARVRSEGGAGIEIELDRRSQARIPVSVPARGMTWLVIE